MIATHASDSSADPRRRRYAAAARAAYSRLNAAAQRAVRTSLALLAPIIRISVAEWAERNRNMVGGWAKGSYLVSSQPTQRGVLACVTDASVREIWCQKSSQWGWTQGILLNVIFWRIALDPCEILIFFAKDDAAKKFNREKLEPAIRATPCILEKIPLEHRTPDNAHDYKGFPGGFIQLAGTNSAANIKSTDSPFVAVEEPDETSANVQDQGDAIVIARERMKGQTNPLMLVGGTATIAKVSKMAAGMEKTDKRRFFVHCPHCQARQTLVFDQVQWLKNAPSTHPVYGLHQPDTARYLCADEACGALWTQSELYRAIRVASELAPHYGWHATAPFTGVAGFYVSDMLSFSPGAKMADQARKFLEAHHDLKTKGDDRGMVSFYNNQRGEAYEIQSDAPEVEILKDRGLDYQEWQCPAGGLRIVAFVDVQRGGERSGEARLHYNIKAYGRDMESWLIARGIVLGNPLEDAVWLALDELWKRPIKNLGGGDMRVEACGIDSSDGMTSEAVYKYVRRKRGGAIRFMATKGVRGLARTAAHFAREIYTPPKPVEVNGVGKADKWGVKIYIVGTTRAKDLIDGRLKLEGSGSARMHWYADVHEDYFRQLTGEVKIPDKYGRKVWTQKEGQPVEDLDCEVGCLHAAYRLGLHRLTDSDWTDIEIALRQRTLLSELEAPQAPPTQPETPARTITPVMPPKAPDGTPSTRFNGFGAGRRSLI